MSNIDEDIKAQNDYAHITEWHNAGITGEGVVVLNCEGYSEHGKTTNRRIHDSAPNCEILQASLSLVTQNDKYVQHTIEYENYVYDIEEFIAKFKVRIITASIHGSNTEGTFKSEYWNNLKKKYNLVFVTIAGNHSTNSIGGLFPPDVAMLVGACYYSKGKPIKAGYSSVGKQLDFMGFTGIWSGTSFAAPWFAGMCALLLQKYPKMTQEDIYAYFKAQAEDLEIAGKDDRTGYGLARMGLPNDNIMEDEMITRTKVKVDGKIVEVQRILKNNENYIRLRDFEDVLGIADIEYDVKEKIPVIED